MAKKAQKTMYVAGVIVDGMAMYEMVDGGIANNLARKDLDVDAAKVTAQRHADKIAAELRRDLRWAKPFVTKVTVTV